MTRPPEKLDADVQRWMRYASDDLAAVDMVLSYQDSPSWIAAFHAQQAAEKALKAFLISREVSHPLTHDIGVLLEHCSDHASWPRELDDAYMLTEFSVMTRYPGVGAEVSKNEATAALEIATRLYKVVQRELLDAGFSVE